MVNSASAVALKDQERQNWSAWGGAWGPEHKLARGHKIPSGAPVKDCWFY